MDPIKRFRVISRSKNYKPCNKDSKNNSKIENNEKLQFAGQFLENGKIVSMSASAIMMFLTVSAIVVPYLYSELKREDDRK